MNFGVVLPKSSKLQWEGNSWTIPWYFLMSSSSNIANFNLYNTCTQLFFRTIPFYAPLLNPKFWLNLQNEKLKIHISSGFLSKLVWGYLWTITQSEIKPQRAPMYEYYISFSLPWQSYFWDNQTVGTAARQSLHRCFLPVKHGMRFHRALYSA